MVEDLSTFYSFTQVFEHHGFAAAPRFVAVGAHQD